VVWRVGVSAAGVLGFAVWCSGVRVELRFFTTANSETLPPNPASVVTQSSRFRGGLGFKAHRLLYHSTLGLRVIKKKKKKKK